MIDTRFHPFIGAIRLGDLLSRAGHGNLVTDDNKDILVEGASELSTGKRSSISFAEKPAYAKDLRASDSGIIIVHPRLVEDVKADAICLVADNAYGIFIDVLNLLYPDNTRAVVSSSFTLEGLQPIVEPGVQIAPGVVIGSGCEIGSGSVIGPNSVLGAGVTIGRNSIIGAGVKIDCAYIGNDVVIHAGVVIGTEGFGFQIRQEHHKKIPQLGRVIIQDRVELGANTTVDRGALGDTVIGEGTKIDNLVQVGHNCKIGRNCMISGTVALAGSSVLEDNVVLGGGAAVSGHITIGRGSVVFARAGVTHSLPAGSTVAGAPAQDYKAWRKEVAAMRRLLKGDSL